MPIRGRDTQLLSSNNRQQRNAVYFLLKVAPSRKISAKNGKNGNTITEDSEHGVCIVLVVGFVVRFYNYCIVILVLHANINEGRNICFT